MKGHSSDSAVRFRLNQSPDEWQTDEDTSSSSSGLGIEYVDTTVLPTQRSPICFTIFWTDANKWEDRDYEVKVWEMLSTRSNPTAASPKVAGQPG